MLALGGKLSGANCIIANQANTTTHMTDIKVHNSSNVYTCSWSLHSDAVIASNSDDRIDFNWHFKVTLIEAITALFLKRALQPARQVSASYGFDEFSSRQTTVFSR